MTYMNIDASLSPEAVVKIKTALNTVRERLPFWVHISVQERRRFFKIASPFLLNAAGLNSHSKVQNVEC
ncbi:MAG: hypothetical protein AAGF98_16640 [Cyanobacteria bacterium P01_H01_bin.153]